MKLTLFLIYTLPFLNFIGSNSVAQTIYSSQEAKEDYSFLIQQIQTYNPALDSYNPNFEPKVQELFSSLPPQINSFEHFKIISKIASLSNEGHFMLGNWEDEVHLGIIEDQLAYPPFEVWILDKRIYIRLDLTEEGYFTPGDEIIEINGKSSEGILTELYECYPSDGDIITFKQSKIESNFAWLYTLYLNQEPELDIQLRKLQDGTMYSVDATCLTRTKRMEYYQKRYPERANLVTEETIQDFFELDFEEDLATLKLKSFDFRLIEKYKLNASKFYQDIFQKLQQNGTQKLLIDLRGNTGGRNEFADEIIPFILQTEGNEMLKTTISWEGRVRNYPFPKKSKYAYKGTILVLIDGETYSAGASVARYLKEYGNAQFIGEETGTRYEGFAAGSIEMVTLPQSGFKIGIPRYHINYPISKKQNTENRGLIPDYIVRKTLGDLLEERDPIWDKAINLLLEK